MPIFHAVVLALTQGLTEFLPISSSAHLILVPWFLGWPDQGLAFDVVVHLGTLSAVCLYFRDDIAAIIGAWLGDVGLRGRAARAGIDRDAARLGWLIIAATIPVGLAGLLAKDWVSTAARNPTLIGVTSIVFGLLLWGADRRGSQDRETATWPDAILIGLSQAVALIPGVSRSGITMTAGRALGLSRQGAARFSFLMSIPVIALSGGLEVLDLAQNGLGTAALPALTVGFVTAAISAYLCIKYLMAFLARHPMDVFVIYRVLLGILILALAT